MILIEILKKALKFFPQKQVTVCGRKRGVFQEFYDRVDRLSYCLKVFGIGKDNKVAILHPNCHYFLVAYYKITKIGAISVPINHRLLPSGLQYLQ